MANFDVELNDEVENFTVEFGEIQRITVDDFDKLRNRPSYAGQTMTHETNIPEVPTAVSQLTNDADYQTGSEVESAISTAVGDEKDAREQADTELSRDIGVVDGKVDAEADARERADTALQGAIDDEETARKNADNGLQGQIDAITSSSDVVDIVGTYAELLQYPTAGLGDKDVIKVLQDETHNDAMSYYRWNKSSSTWSYIGSEGPYYTKSETNTLLGDKQDTLTAGSNVTIQGNTISATDTTYTAGNGLTLTGTEFSADTTVLQPKLTAGGGINISAHNVISADIDPADFFTASETVDGTGSEITLNNTIQAKIKSVQMDGDTYQPTYSGWQMLGKDGCATPTSDTAYWRVVNYTQTILGNGWARFYNGTSSAIDFGNLQVYTGSQFKVSTTYTIIFEIQNLDNKGNDTYLVYAQPAQASDSIASATVVYNPSEAIARADGCGWDKLVDGQYVGVFTTKSELKELLPRMWFRFIQPGGTFDLRISIIKGDHSSDWQNYAGDNWQPFVGATASPNPDYPQAVQTVTGEQTVTVAGKNLFDNDKALEGRYLNASGGWTSGAIAYINQEYRISSERNLNISFAQRVGVPSVRLGEYREDGSFIKRTLVQTQQAIVLDESTEKIIFSVDGLAPNYFENLQIEFGAATSYEPYHAQSYTVNLGTTELCKIGDYQDYIYKSGDDWYVHKATGKQVISTSSIGLRSTYTNVEYATFDKPTDYGGYGSFGYSYPVVSTHAIFKNNPSNWDDASNAGGGYTGANQGQCWIGFAKDTGLDTIKTKLTGCIIYYALATPTDTQITDATLISELDALADALGCKDKTIITVSATGTNLPAILEVSAYRNSLAGVLGVIGRAEAA